VARLEASAVTVRFGGTAALVDVSVQIEAAAITGLIGPNGAGKTTMFNVMTGLQAPDGGRVVLDGRDITSAPPHRRARLGLARTFQRLELFTSLSVRDNVRVAGDIWARWAVRSLPGRFGLDQRTDDVLERTGLTAIADREVSEVPTAKARLVELARALMLDPSVLLLDEPAAGQSEADTEAFSRLLRRLADDGLAVCLVEHDMTLVMDVCETIHVLDYGRTIAVGAPDEVRRDPAVIDAYLGTPEGIT
jgi:branched-chain amino acid transport system ATP-binding protein